jgi:hypothetical protein
MFLGRRCVRLSNSLFMGGVGKVDVNFKERLFYNRVGRQLLFPLCDGRFETILADLIEGGPQVLRHLSSMVTNQDKNGIIACTEDNLSNKIIEESFKEETGAVKWEISGINSVRVNKLQCIMGFVRGDDLKQKLVIPMMGQIFVIDAGDLPDDLNFRQRLELLKNELSGGVTVRAQVYVNCTQMLTVGSITDANPSVDHLINLEMKLTPHSDIATQYRPTSTPNTPPPDEVTLECSEWKLVDINNIMGGNHPIDKSE